MTKTTLRCSTFAAFAVIVASAAPARAGDPAVAEQLFREGRERLDAGDYADACPKLAESYAQDAATGTLLALAVCQEMTGKTASAWASYGEVAARSRREGRADREQAATEHQAALEPKLSYLTIDVDARARAVPGLVVVLDGIPVGAAAWGSALPADPGVHRITATAPGKDRSESWVTVAAEADKKTIAISPLADAPAPTITAPSARTPAEPDHRAPAPATSSLRWIGLGVGAAGVVGLGLGTFFGLHAMSLDASSKQDGHCNANDACDALGGARRSDALSFATTSTVTFVAGGVLAATGVTLFLLGGPPSDAAHVRDARLVVGLNGAELSGSY